MFALFESTWAKEQNALLVITTNVSVTTPSGGRTSPAKYGVMGRGCALTAAKRWPALRRWWAEQVADGVRAGWHHWSGGDRNIGCLVVKRNWWEPARLGLIDQGLAELKAWADTAGCQLCLMPLPGGSNGRLSHEPIKELCRRHLDDRFIVCMFQPQP